jgi:hypothetical protein
MLDEFKTETCPHKKHLIEARNVLQGALFIDVFLNIIAIFYCYKTISALNNFNDFTQPVIDNINTSEILLRLTMLTMLFVGVALFAWLNSCYKYAKNSIGITDFKYEGWTALGWIIPIWSAFRPYQIINELYKAGTPVHNIKDIWQKEPASGFLLAWWIFYVFLHLVIIFITRLVMSDHNVEITPHYFELTFKFYIAICVISLTIAGLWREVILNITSRLLSQDKTSKINETINSGNSNLATPADSAKDTQTIALDNNAFLLALEEYESDERDKGLWAKCFAISNGDEAITKSMYLKERAINFADSGANKKFDEDAKKIL